MSAPFADVATAQRFREDGFVVFPLLGPAELAAVRAVYHRWHGFDLGRHVRHDFSSTFFTSVFVDDLAYRRAVHDGLWAAMRPALARTLGAFRAWYCGFAARLPAPSEAYEPHTDPSFVDEAVHTPFHLWCPLDDVTEAEGALEVLPGSVRLSSRHRGGTLPCRLRPHAEQLRSHMVPLTTPAGTAVAFHPGTLHGSTPNRSGRPRVAATVLVSDPGAGLQIAWRDPGRPDTIDLYAQPDDYYLRSTQFTEVGVEPPRLGHWIGSVPHERVELSGAAISGLLRRAR